MKSPCDGMTSTQSLMVPGMDPLIDVALTRGEVADISQAQNRLRGRELDQVVADKGYDSDELVEFMRGPGAKAVIRPHRIAARHHQLAERCASIVTLGASFGWLSTERRMSTGPSVWAQA